MMMRITKTITAEVTHEVAETGYFALMRALDVPINANMTCPQAPKPDCLGYITWTWEEEVEVDL